MEENNRAVQGKPYAGNPHVRFEEGAGTPVHTRCSALLYKDADASHTQNLAKSNQTTPAPWTVQWHLKGLKSARGLRRNRISPRSYIQKVLIQDASSTESTVA